MVELNTEVAGIKFENPIIIGSSTLTNDVGKIKKLVNAGAGGIITKLISDVIPSRHTYAAKATMTKDGLLLVGDKRVKLENGIKLVGDAKRELDVPIIANIAGLGEDLDSWLRVAIPLRDAGADAFELDMRPGQLVTPELAKKVIRKLCRELHVPLVMKMAERNYDYIEVGKAGAKAGACAISGPNVISGILPPDVENGTLKPTGYPDMVKEGLAGVFAGPVLNPAGLIFALSTIKMIKLPLISGGGVMGWKNAVERIALGASAVSLVSAIYLNGLSTIEQCKTGIKKFLEDKHWQSVTELKGKALENYGDEVESIVDLPSQAACIDMHGTWPNRLSDDWWSS